MVKYKGQLTEKEFLQKIKKREKVLLLEEAHREVRKELDDSLKNIKVNITFFELVHIQEYLKGNDKEYHREKLEEGWRNREFLLESIRLKEKEDKKQAKKEGLTLNEYRAKLKEEEALRKIEEKDEDNLATILMILAVIGGIVIIIAFL